MIKCPVCGEGDFRTTNTFNMIDAIYRRRKCTICGHVAMTVEKLESEVYELEKDYEKRAVNS